MYSKVILIFTWAPTWYYESRYVPLQLSRFAMVHKLIFKTRHSPENLENFAIMSSIHLWALGWVYDVKFIKTLANGKESSPTYDSLRNRYCRLIFHANWTVKTVLVRRIHIGLNHDQKHLLKFYTASGGTVNADENWSNNTDFSDKSSANGWVECSDTNFLKNYSRRWRG